MEEIRKIGLLGGTFDPVHNGHLAVAVEVKKMLDLDELWFVPAAEPPHKAGYRVSSFAVRAAMLDLAVAGRPGFVVSRLEADLPKPSYTIDTLRALRDQLGPGVRFFFIIGADAFAEISTWKDYDRLLAQADFAVLARPPYTAEVVADIVLKYFPGCRFDDRAGVWKSARAGQGAIYLLAPGPYSVSSTLVREMVRSGKPLSGLVLPGVAGLIKEDGLYL